MPKALASSGTSVTADSKTEQTDCASKLIKLLVSIIVAIASLDLLGWVLHIRTLTSFLPSYATMKPNTALCLGLLAVACVATSETRKSVSRSKMIAAVSLPGFALLLSGGSLIEYIAHKNTGLDGLFLQVAVDRYGDPIGRMSLGTALCLTVIGVALLLRDRSPRLCTGCLLSVTAVAASALVGFLFGAGPLFGVPWLSSMAVHTAFCVLLVAVAVLVSRPKREPVFSLMPYRLRGGSRQWLLVAVTVPPIVVALPAVIAMRRGIVDVSFTMAFVVVVLIALQTCILWRDSRALHQAGLQRAQVEVALVRSEKLAVVGRMSASICHEIKNPLDAVTNLMFLIEGSESLIEAKQLASTAGGELARINQIASQTLSFHRDSRNLTSCEPSKIVESALQLLSPRITAGGVTMTRQYREGSETVNCPDGELRQVLINLISNAIEATPSGGKLVLRTRVSRMWGAKRPSQRGIRILCADTGVGMPADIRKDIFEPFFTTKVDTGNGLGLWVAQELVAKLGGSIRVWSSTLQAASGTVFCIFLPFINKSETKEGLRLPPSCVSDSLAFGRSG